MRWFLIKRGGLGPWLLASSVVLAESAPKLSMPKLSMRQVNRLAEKAAQKAAQRLGHSLTDYDQHKPVYDPHGKPPGWSVSYTWHAKHRLRNGVMVWQIALDSGFGVFVDDKTAATKAEFPGE